MNSLLNKPYKSKEQREKEYFDRLEWQAEIEAPLKERFKEAGILVFILVVVYIWTVVLFSI